MPDPRTDLPVKPFVAHAGGRWFITPTGRAVSLQRRTTLAALLRELGALRTHTPGVSVTPDVLIAHVWPGEKILPHAARNRLHVAVHALRAMGFGAALRFDGSGYAFDPAVPFLRAVEDSASELAVAYAATDASGAVRFPGVSPTL